MEITSDHIKIAKRVASNFSTQTNLSHLYHDFIQAILISIWQDSTQTAWQACITEARKYHNLRNKSTKNICFCEFTDSISHDVFNIDDLVLLSHIYKKIQLIPEPQRKVLIDYFYKGNTLKEIGKALGVTRERVRQIKAAGLNRLRKHFRNGQPVARKKRIIKPKKKRESKLWSYTYTPL